MSNIINFPLHRIRPPKTANHEWLKKLLAQPRLDIRRKSDPIPMAEATIWKPAHFEVFGEIEVTTWEPDNESL